MKIINTTDFADYFLRRMVVWCCHHLGLPVRRVKQCRFGNSSRHYGGLAYYRSRIGVRVGSAASCDRELKHHKFNDGFQIITYSRLELLLSVTAHELAHLEQFWRILHVRQALERRTEAQAARLLDLFRANQQALLAEWQLAPTGRAKSSAETVQDRRAAKAAADLARWQRKLRLAQTKVSKLKQRVKYYEQATAAKRGQL